MARKKVEICGVNTSSLPLLSEEEKEDISIAYDGWTYFLSWWMQRSMDETKDRENEGCESYSGR